MTNQQAITIASAIIFTDIGRDCYRASKEKKKENKLVDGE